MKVIIEASPEEIAALVVAIQELQKKDVTVTLEPGCQLSSSADNSIRKQPVEMTEEEFNHLLREYSESRTRLKF